MDHEQNIPDWVETLSTALANTIEVPATIHFGWYYEPPHENDFGIHALTLYPEPVEIQEAGPKDGEFVFLAPNGVDILAIYRQFDEVDALTLAFEQGHEPAISITGKYKGQAVIVFLFLHPNSDHQEDEI